MEKGKFIETILLRINGGQLNSDSAVQRRDIRAYAPAAINYAMMAGYNINIQVEENRDFSSLFYTYFPAEAVLTDTARHGWKYVLYPKGTVPLPKNQGVRTVEDGCGYNLKPLSDNAFRTIKHHMSIFTAEKYYRPEGNKIYLFGLPAPTNQINLVMIVDFDSLADTDMLPIPAGLEEMAINKCYEFIMGIRQTPADRKSDQRDIN